MNSLAAAHSEPEVVEVDGRKYRRIPRPRPKSPTASGREFRAALLNEQETQLQKILCEDERWSRMEHSAREADEAYRERRTRDAQRESWLYASACAWKRNGGRPKSASATAVALPCAIPLLHHKTTEKKHRGKPESLPCNVGSRASLAKRDVSQTSSSSSPYDTYISIPALEKERMEKPHAIAHAKQDLLSIGVIEAKVEHLHHGNIQISDLVQLCNRAAENAQRSEEQVTVYLRSQYRDKDDLVSGRTSAPLSGKSTDSTTLRPFIPIGKEIERISTAMHHASQKESAVAFERLQAAKRAAYRAVTEIVSAQTQHLMRELTLGAPPRTPTPKSTPMDETGLPQR